MELVRNAHRLDVTDRGSLARELDALGELVRAVPLKALDFPHDFSRLPAVCTAILADTDTDTNLESPA